MNHSWSYPAEHERGKGDLRRALEAIYRVELVRFLGAGGEL